MSISPHQIPSTPTAPATEPDKSLEVSPMPPGRSESAMPGIRSTGSQDRTVIAFGLDGSVVSSRLVSLLNADGLDVVNLNVSECLPDVLDLFPKVTVLIYAGEHCNCAHAVLKRLSDCFRRCPVVVVVDRSDLSEYQELVLEGANYYYALSEGPEAISRAVAWADRQAC